MYEVNEKKDNKFISLAKSVPRDDIPIAPKHVRGEVMSSGMFFRSRLTSERLLHRGNRCGILHSYVYCPSGYEGTHSKIFSQYEFRRPTPFSKRN